MNATSVPRTTVKDWNAYDPFEGTIYRDIYNAQDAIDYARFLNGDVPADRGRALEEMIEQLDKAARAIRDARVRAAEELAVTR